MLNWKLIGTIATIVGAGVSLISSIADDKKMEETVDRKLNEALAKKEEESE